MDERPSGWYDDPDEPSRLRYWDGQSWTERTHEKAPMPAPQPPKPITRLRPSRDDSDASGAGGRDGGQAGSAGTAATHDASGPVSHQRSYGTQDAPRPWATGAGDRGAPQQPAENAPRRAGYGRRVLAFLIDFLIVSIIWFVLFIALIPVFGGDVQGAWNTYLASTEKYVNEVSQAASQAGGQAVNLPARPEIPEALLGYTVASGALLAALAVLFDFLQMLWGRATLGYRLAGIRVRGADPQARVSAGRLVLRSILKYAFLIAAGPLTLLGLAFTAVNFAWPLSDPQRRALHDKWMGTHVVRRR